MKKDKIGRACNSNRNAYKVLVRYMKEIKNSEHCTTSQKAAGSILDVTGFFQLT
jgi:hypothetical protein